MLAYIGKRLLLMIPTLIGVLTLTFVVIQFVPGGPIEQVIAKMQGTDTDATARISGNAGNEAGGNEQSQLGGDAGIKYKGAQGLDPEFIKSLEKQFGFDRPVHERFLKMIGDYATFDFGRSYFRDRTVIDLIVEKMPVSISLGLWLTLITYLVSIPLGIRTAVHAGSNFDVWTSAVIIVGYAIPSFILAILLIVSIFTSSGFMLQSVSEEKETRVMEVLLSSVSATQLLTAKIIGLGALGLLQVAVWFGGLGAVALLGLSVLSFVLSLIHI